MYTISANDVKRKGISVFFGHEEAFVTVRGKPEYVVMNVAAYESLREAALEAAVMQAKRDIENGNYVTESIDEHIKRITEDHI